MKKITKIIFQTEEVGTDVIKSNIDAPKLAVKNICKIELAAKKEFKPKYQPKSENQVELKPKFYHNFPIENWEICMDAAIRANKIVGNLKITLSKKAYINGSLDSNYFSVWFSCSSIEMRDNFIKPLTIILNTNGMKKMSKVQIQAIFIQEFFIMFIDEQCNFDIFRCRKTEKSSTEVKYEITSNPGYVYSLQLSEISLNGSTQVKYEYGESEDVYFFISETVENIN